MESRKALAQGVFVIRRLVNVVVRVVMGCFMRVLAAASRLKLYWVYNIGARVLRRSKTCVRVHILQYVVTCSWNRSLLEGRHSPNRC